MVSPTALVGDGGGGYYAAEPAFGYGTPGSAVVVHVLADDAIAPLFSVTFGGAANPTVAAMAMVGGVLYLAGNFNLVDGQARSELAAVNGATGALLAWAPSPNGPVNALAASAQAVYAGGSFMSVSGSVSDGLAALDPSSGAVLPSNLAVESGGVAGSVAALAVSGSTLYVTGAFDRIGGVPRLGLAGVDAATNAPTAWDPAALPARGAVLAVSGTDVYVAGHDFVAARDVGTGAAEAGFTDPGFDGDAQALTIAGERLILGGDFVDVGGSKHPHLASLDLQTGATDPSFPIADDYVTALMVDGDRVLVAGGDSVGGVIRTELAAFDAATLAVSPWDPTLACEPTTLAASDTAVYVAESCSGGLALEAFDPVTGAKLPAFDPIPPDGGVNTAINALAMDGSSLLVAGSFDHIAGAAANNIALLNPTTGALESFGPGTSGPVATVDVEPNAVYVDGNFTFAGGQPRSGLAALDPSTGLATSFDPTPDGRAQGIAVLNNTVYVGAGTRIQGFAADGGSAAARYNFTVEGTAPSVLATTSGSLYAYGAFENSTVLEIDPTTGAIRPWAPGGGPTGYGVHGPGTLLAYGNRVMVGGFGPDFDGMAVFDPLTTPVNTSAPRITGEARPGAALTCSTGAWTQEPADYQYSWTLDRIPIRGATASSYTIVGNDQGQAVRCNVTASNTGGSATATSIPVAVPALALTIKRFRESASASCTSAPPSPSPSPPPPR
jgi:hypothetical protein